MCETSVCGSPVTVVSLVQLGTQNTQSGRYSASQSSHCWRSSNAASWYRNAVPPPRLSAARVTVLLGRARGSGATGKTALDQPLPLAIDRQILGLLRHRE